MKWARSAVGGDQAVLDALLRQIRRLVLARCARFLPCWQDAEEASQGVLFNDPMVGGIMHGMLSVMETLIDRTLSVSK